MATSRPTARSSKPSRTTSPSYVRSRANDAAIFAGLLWCAGGIELNAPQLDRTLALILGAVLLGLSLRGSAVGPAVAVYAVFIAFPERWARVPFPDGSQVLRATDQRIGNSVHGLNAQT